jgi:hypothetical protein
MCAKDQRVSFRAVHGAGGAFQLSRRFENPIEEDDIAAFEDRRENFTAEAHAVSTGGVGIAGAVGSAISMELDAAFGVARKYDQV